MGNHFTRRTFLRSSATIGAVATVGEWSGLLALAPASGEDTQLTPELIRFTPELESVVRLIETTPQEKCVAAVVERLRGGLPYRNFLAALYLAAIRAATYHGNGPHAYDHNAYVVHSAHQLGLDLPPGEQLLPAFIALDSFKGMQQAYPNKSGEREPRGEFPGAGVALEELHAAMRGWEPERAERAIVALVRSQGSSAVMEPLWHYAARDWGFIGHNSILVANSCRLLATIGWQHAEHVLRYVVAGLTGWPKERAEGPDVQPYLRNLPRVYQAVGQLPGNWAEPTGNAGLTKDLLTLIREAKPYEACDVAVRHLTTGTAQAGAVWDAIHLAAGELLLSSRPHNAHRTVNSAALHANTAANALHYAFRASSQAHTRLLVTLQALAWMDLFRRGIVDGKHLVEELDITQLEGPAVDGDPEAAIAAILAARTATPREASRMTFSFAQRHSTAELWSAATRLIPSKCSGDPHDLKFPVAVYEDYQLVSPAWRPHVMAAAAQSFWGSERPDLPVIEQVREAVRGL